MPSKQITVTWDDTGAMDVTFDPQTIEPNDLVSGSFVLARIANRLLDAVEIASIKEPTIIPATTMPRNGDN